MTLRLMSLTGRVAAALAFLSLLARPAPASAGIMANLEQPGDGSILNSGVSLISG